MVNGDAIVRSLITLAAMFVTAFAPPAFADQALHPLQGIRDAAQGFVSRELGGTNNATRIEVGRLDPRLRLAQCGSELQVSYQTHSAKLANTTVRVACSGPKPWSLYVPVSVKRFQKVVVLARPVAPGSTVTRDDVRLEELSVDGLVSGYFTRTEDVVGLQMRRSMGVGQALTRLAVLAPKLVSRGERVIVLAGTDGLEVRVEGTALTDGAVGDRLRVRNNRSRRVVEGTLGPDGTVRVRM